MKIGRDKKMSLVVCIAVMYGSISLIFAIILWIWLWYGTQLLSYKFIGPFSGWCDYVSLSCGENDS